MDEAFADDLIANISGKKIYGSAQIAGEVQCALTGISDDRMRAQDMQNSCIFSSQTSSFGSRAVGPMPKRLPESCEGDLVRKRLRLLIVLRS
jgi:hypothetical protein